MIDRTLDDYKEELQRTLFPMFAVLYVTMIRRGFEDKAAEFMEVFGPRFHHQDQVLNQDLTLLRSVRTQDDLMTSLRADKYILNKF